MRHVFDKNHTLTITGDTSELKVFIKELCDVMDKYSFHNIKDDVNNLERVVDLIPYTFGMHHRIYFNKEKVFYTPNVHSDEGRNFHFKIFEGFFNKALDNFYKKYEYKK